ncbi:hypothetical protein CDIK_0313 [Cucumispora dikerogammari]|nr:hypothetical protein CDIK_0313 [Cucumispora dikerogammari]
MEVIKTNQGEDNGTSFIVYKGYLKSNYPNHITTEDELKKEINKLLDVLDINYSEINSYIFQINVIFRFLKENIQEAEAVFYIFANVVQTSHFGFKNENYKLQLVQIPNYENILSTFYF